jgi:hypothetical protein
MNKHAVSWYFNEKTGNQSVELFIAIGHNKLNLLKRNGTIPGSEKFSRVVF